MAYIPEKLLKLKLLEFLKEDSEYGDITSDLVPDVPVVAYLIAKQNGIICGVKFAKILLESLDIEVKILLDDGNMVEKGQTILELRGKSRRILTSERTVLNLIMRLSGIATKTRKYVEYIKKSNLDILVAATRKTTPGFRYFEKYAVIVGGGDPHRWSLSDTILIKENHLYLLGKSAIKAIFTQSRKKFPFSKKVEIEVESLDELKEALNFSPDIIMLDNFSINDVQEAIEIVQHTQSTIKPLIEVSGGISEQNFNDFLIPGINIISLGSLTHSVESLDFTLKIKEIFGS